MNQNLDLLLELIPHKKPDVRQQFLVHPRSTYLISRTIDELKRLKLSKWP